MSETTFNLRSLTEELATRFPSVSELYLFGSRKWRTGSPRSDLDILVCHSKHIRPADLRYFSLNSCPALDLFLVSGPRAVSAANESYIEANTFEELIARLGAIHFWSRDVGFLDSDIDWDFRNHSIGARNLETCSSLLRDRDCRADHSSAYRPMRWPIS